MKAKTTEEITESMKGWSAERMAAVKFAKLAGAGHPVAVLHRKGAIVYGDEAAALIAVGKAIEVIDKPPAEPQQ
jgi:hypothetical protein